MKIGTIRGRLLTSTMMGGIAVVAAGALPVAVVTLAPTVASAQDYTTGGLAGTVADQSGRPISGATVTIRSTEQGFSRTTTTGANGAFRASLVPLGNYEVSIAAPGFETSVDPRVTVRLGSEASYTFTLGTSDSGATNIDEIVVVGTRPELDFTQTTTGLTVDVAELVTRVPVGRSVTAVALLAPKVIPGDANFGNQPSLGGSSVAENAFYVNGLNITNFNNYVGGGAVPFDFYRTIDVQTGGYPAEFGRATGGVLNAVTKSGTNEFMFALHGNWSPDSLRETSPDTYLTNNGRGYDESWSIIAEAGGPIIRDRLYAYGLYQWQESETETYGITTGTKTVNTNDIPFWGVKLDAYLTESQRLEFTYFDTEGEADNTNYSYNNATGAVGANPQGGNTPFLGGQNWVARYTGNFTDWLTISAAYGKNEDSGYTAAKNLVDNYAADVRTGTSIRVSPNQTQIASNFQHTERTFYRGDVDLTFSYLGDHHVRMGFDHEETELSHSVLANGPTPQAYFYYAGDDYVTIDGQDYIDVLYENLGAGGAPVKGENTAFYIQDAWEITEDLSIQIGLRHDQFKLSNLSGEQVLDLKENWGPRLAFTLDPIGNGVDKFYGSYGRYFIPPASNLSFRGYDSYADVYFLPAGNAATITVDPATGLPVGGLGDAVGAVTPGGFAGELQICPDFVPGNAAGTASCFVYGNGTQEPADAKYALGTKATNEDEFIIGYQRRLDDLWTVGAAVTYRTLNNVSEDIAVDYLVLQYCEAQGISCPEFTGDHQYVIANPGEDLSFLVRETLPNGQRPILNFTASEVGLPKARRDYLGLEVSFERAYDGVWSLQGSYTLSKSEGNYEGTVLSDNSQADAGSTILYDHYGLTEGTYGLLPNHRAHQFKLFGSYTFFDSLTVGANYSLISPRHFGCLGRSQIDPFAAAYGAASFNCPIGPNGTYISTPRGSQFESDWTSTLDLSLRYTLPTYGFMPKGVTLRADVFNVFDDDAAQDFVETGSLSGGAPNPRYQLPIGYQAPRSVRFGFDIAF